jgi:hypothetical protein
MRLLRRRSAVHSYFWLLSQELCRRFGKKDCYGIEEVTTAAREGRFEMAFLAYAHGMFCGRAEFDAHYGPMRVACTYDGVRQVVARRFFDGATGFDAMTILHRATPPRQEEYNFTQNDTYA